jgi:hypothetical protein
MPSAEVFSSVRAALEATRGTGVNPTRYLEFTDFTPTHDTMLIRPRESRASLFGHYRAAAGRTTGGVSFSGNLSYNQLAWLGETFIKAVGTGVGAGADKTYAYTPASATDDVKSATIEYGFDTSLSAGTPGFRQVYCLGRELNITWDKGSQDGVTFSADFTSPSGASQITSFGGTPTQIASTAMSPNNTAITIDAATIGTTADLYAPSLSWTLTNGFTDLNTLNNTSGAQATFRTGEWAWTAELTRYYVNDNEQDRFVDKAVRKIRVVNTGPALGGSTYRAQLDLYGVIENATWDRSDGLVMETLTYVPVYDSTAATHFALTVVTAEASIT